jgi:hypothetical protein
MASLIARPWLHRCPRLSRSAPATSTYHARLIPPPPPPRLTCWPPPTTRPPRGGSGSRAASLSPRARRRGRGGVRGTWRLSGQVYPCTSHAPTTCSSPMSHAPSPRKLPSLSSWVSLLLKCENVQPSAQHAACCAHPASSLLTILTPIFTALCV